MAYPSLAAHYTDRASLWFNAVVDERVFFTTFNKDNTMADINPQTWPGMGAELFDLLTGRRAEIIYHLDNMEVHIPAGTHAPGASPAYAIWKFNGAIRIRSRIHSDGV